MNNRQPGRPMKAKPRILAAASELFLTQGLDISLDVIATEAGTTRQTLYNHFPGKDALVLETFNYMKDMMQPPINAILAGDTQDIPLVLMRFATVVQDHFFQTKNLHFQRLLIQLLQQRPELYATLQQRDSGRVLQGLVSLLQQAQQRGALDVKDVELQAKAFLGAVMGYPLPAALLTDDIPDKAHLHRLATTTIALFLRAWGYQDVISTENVSRQ
ncbi:TetR/AcrR family transcriptional regulator [Serratia grimesii]|jgi:TetR/AcrR family transcriptional repressor of mexJK operon|uniref:TetR/AcrR family transcriptional regulator n=1 Tax=Serratia grimesii TaxID=82995 RepID=UPI00077CB3C9|nr:TetR/AcrR family transcriptional regulator [Serratia grimesii]CAI0832778.1 Solvent efflux pump srpABC operon corepressor [Serratia grimesii]CAI0856706.1 Solvent efflux pump srpABC operon corepressor [Serratia grimesii]CAI2427110.1 Solvent efflux pump srpABC operon corepressor [Serratia grimesii]SUI34282.1 Solvent efflux pump srpABC operon corepressor [Serratia grimesii]